MLSRLCFGGLANQMFASRPGPSVVLKGECIPFNVRLQSWDVPFIVAKPLGLPWIFVCLRVSSWNALSLTGLRCPVVDVISLCYFLFVFHLRPMDLTCSRLPIPSRLLHPVVTLFNKDLPISPQFSPTDFLHRDASSVQTEATLLLLANQWLVCFSPE